jgi:tyrosinase-like protein
MEDAYVRRDAWTLDPGGEGDPWDAYMLGYARAVRVMQARARDNPTGWARQAALCASRPRGTWFLLPWLRMRLWYFERVVRRVVVAYDGPADWALPYWGYADGAPAHAALPRAFATPCLPDGAPNPLFRPDRVRAPGLNAGAQLPASLTSAARALAARTFSPGLGGEPTGPSPRTDPPPPGLLEAQPLDTVTAFLGPDAALDPIYPLHLAAVDRLWEAWLAGGGGRANPVQFDWTDQWFHFYDADGRSRSLTCGQAGDLANLDYRYAGLPARAGCEHVLQAGADAGPLPCWAGLVPEVATGAPGAVELGAEPRRVALRPVGAGSRVAEAVGGAVETSSPRLYLHLEDAAARSGPGSVWEVRVEGGRGGAAEAAVGTIAFPGRGARAQRFVLDITDAVDGLAPGWDARALAVSFHPALPDGFAPEPPPAARVGRVFVTNG